MSWKYDKDKITYFADTDFRGQRVRFGIRAEDRARHMYIIGKTGMGKSTLLENLAAQDIQNGEGMCFIDPHGGTAELLLKYVPKERINDVVYFAPHDMDFPVAMNVLEKADMTKRPLIASGLLSAFKKVWPDSFSARMEYMLSNTLLSLLEMPGATLLGVNRMLADKAYRELVISNITDTSVKSFWIDEFGKWTDKMVAEAVPAIQNKVGQFSANPVIRNILGQSESTFDMRWLMDNRKIFIVNLSKGRIGENNAALIGALLITKIYLAAMSRAELDPEELKIVPPFYLYVDEFQSFANESFADILSEARKYKLCLTVAHQFIAQMTEEVRAAVFGNVGTMIAFRVGAEDGTALEKEFAPVFTTDDFVSLGFAQVYLKLMIKGAASAPFSARTRDKPPIPEVTYENEVIEASRRQFAKPRTQVEKDLAEWLKVDESAAAASSNTPQTKKFAPGMRPDRPPRSDYSQGGNQMQSGGQGGYQSNMQRPAMGSQGGYQPGMQRPQVQAGGIGLRDALARTNAINPQGVQSQVQQQGQPQMPYGQQPVHDQYGNVVQPGYYGGQAQVYSYGQPMMPPVHYGYPYVLPPMMPQYGYAPMPPYQMQPPQMMPPMQYPPAPPYGYQPQHPGYANYMQPQQSVAPERPHSQQSQVQSQYQQRPQFQNASPSRQNQDRVFEKRNDNPIIKEKPVESELKKIENVSPKIEEKKEDIQVVEKPKVDFAKRDDKKGPTAENLDSLSAALAKLQKKVESIPSIEDTPKREGPKEIPKEELKKVLE